MVLDRKQQQAVEALYGPVCIIAGPGSGKTRVLVERTARLIAGGAAPERILAITFTNKAAREMRERLEARLVTGDRLPLITTFHALGYEILKDHGERIGVPTDFSVLEKQKKPADNSVFALDFDDLLVHAHRLLVEHPDIRGLYQSRYEHIAVDEYQDTNAIQAAILDILAAPHGNICVIGDPDQAIYSFRGADPAHFVSFTERYPNAKSIRLERNYRSTAPIINASMGVIGRGGTVHPRAEKNEPYAKLVTICTTSTEQDEARWVIREIEKLIGGSDYSTLGGSSGGYHFGDIAVLYRLNTVGRALEREFSRVAIPFRAIGGVGFFERPEIRNIIAQIQKKTPRNQISKSLTQGSPTSLSYGLLMRFVNFLNKKSSNAYARKNRVGFWSSSRLRNGSIISRLKMRERRSSNMQRSRGRRMTKSPKAQSPS